MKTYLNRDEKNIVYKLAAYMTYTEELYKKFEKLGKPERKEFITHLKKATTWTTKALAAFVHGVDNKERDTLLSELKKMELILTYSADSMREYKRIEALNSYVHLTKDDFFELAGQTMEACRGCKRPVDEINVCKVKDVLLRCDVPVVDEYAQDGVCPYCM